MEATKVTGPPTNKVSGDGHEIDESTLRSLIQLPPPPIGTSKSSTIKACKNVCRWYEATPDSCRFPEAWRKCASSGCHACRLAQLGAEYLLYPDELKAGSGVDVELGGTTVNFSWDTTRHSRSVFLYTRVGSNPTKWPGIGVGREIGCQLKDYSSMVSEWLNTCRQHHSGCPQNVNVSLPARLLDVQVRGSSSVRLVATSAQTGTYTALSHCWGGTIGIRTTQQNIVSQQTGIPFTDLPKNFQDAVTVTRAIGLQYIWIDALCIIQDDADDWEVESGNMAAIYQNAYLVIGANMSPNSEGGFLEKKRDNEHSHRGEPVAVVNGENAVIFARIMPAVDHYLDVTYSGGLVSLGPLSRRAWTLQESLLASRIVNFQKPETTWKCDSARFCECGELDPGHEFRKETHFSLNTLLSVPKWSPERYKDWYRIVQEAAARNITNTKDMLPCVSGLAQRFYRAGAGTYLAGLWLEDLPLGLLWETPSRGSKAIAPYRGPSWSWVSVALPSYNGQGGFLDGDTRLSKLYLEILEAECKPQGKDHFGEVSVGCFIKVAAPMLEIRKDLLNDYEWDLKFIGEERFIHTTGSWFHVILDDRGYEELSGSNKHDKGAWSLFALFVGQLSCGANGTPNQGLVLNKRPDVSDETYERVGAFQFSLETMRSGLTINDES